TPVMSATLPLASATLDPPAAADSYGREVGREVNPARASSPGLLPRGLDRLGREDALAREAGDEGLGHAGDEGLLVRPGELRPGDEKRHQPMARHPHRL